MATVSKRTIETLELVGGALCLDFANTINSRIEPEHDYLDTYPDLLAWCRRTEVLTPQTAERLAQRAQQQPEAVAVVLRHTHELRDTIYRVFSELAGRGWPAQSDLRVLLEASGKAIAQAKLVWSQDHFYPDWADAVELEEALWPVAYSAGTLLCSARLSQVKACPGCQWLFLDESKNQSRRWCNMQTCGTRDKMRRYHQLARAKKEGV